MKVEFYGHVQQYLNIKGEIDANINKCLMSGKYVLGPFGDQFEKELAAFTGHKFAIGVGNGTDAIWLTLMALGIGAGDEVIHDPQVEHLGLIVPVAGAHGGDRSVRPPVQFGGVRSRSVRAPPLLDEDGPPIRAALARGERWPALGDEDTTGS